MNIKPLGLAGLYLRLQFLIHLILVDIKSESGRKFRLDFVAIGLQSAFRYLKSRTGVNV